MHSYNIGQVFCSVWVWDQITTSSPFLKIIHFQLKYNCHFSFYFPLEPSQINDLYFFDCYYYIYIFVFAQIYKYNLLICVCVYIISGLTTNQGSHPQESLPPSAAYSSLSSMSFDVVIVQVTSPFDMSFCPCNFCVQRDPLCLTPKHGGLFQSSFCKILELWMVFHLLGTMDKAQSSDNIFVLCFRPVILLSGGDTDLINVFRRSQLRGPSYK